MGLALDADLTVDREWRQLLSSFLTELESIPGVVRLIALPSPEDRIYESNVLVVVDEYSYELVLRIMEAAARAERRSGIRGVLSPTVATQDEPVVREFEGYVSREEEVDWGPVLSSLLRELESIPGVVRLIALPSPEDRIYESNVLVVVDEYSYELVLRIMEAAARAERRSGIRGVLSPTVATQDEPVVREFEGEGIILLSR